MTENVPQDSVRHIVMNMLIIFLLGAHISYHLSLSSLPSLFIILLDVFLSGFVLHCLSLAYSSLFL